MRTLAIVNQKGGSGKTTTAVNLAAALGEKKQKVLLIDTDPQANATTWYGVPHTEKGLFNVFVNNGNLSDIVNHTDFSGVEIIPSSSWLVGVEKALAGEVGTETLLAHQLKNLPNDQWD